MKLIEVLLHLSCLSAAVGQATRKERDAKYDSICPDKILEEEISPGYTVKYTCDRVGDYDSKSRAAATISECAERCQDTAGCTGSTWNRNTGDCLLSGTSVAKDWPGAILMEEVSPFPEDDDEDDPFPDASCEDEVEELNQCQTALAQCQQGSGSGPTPGSGSGPGSGPDLSGKTCPGTNTIVTVDNKKWKAFCKQSNNRGHPKSEGNMNSIEECIQRCSSIPECVQAVFVPASGACTSVSKSRETTYRPGWNTYVLEE